jgi:hypothetical protein
MPLEAPISTKWRRTGYGWGRTAFLAVLAAGWAGAFAAALPAPGEAPVVRTALEQVSRMEYAEAEETLTKGLPPASPARPYFAGLACMNRFLDLGDTLALSRAERYWETLSPRGDPAPEFRRVDARLLGLYRGLAGMQLSYAASLRGQRVRSTTAALAARSHLEASASEEARAALMLFDYYRGRLLEKLPFVGSSDFDVKAFERRAAASPALRDMFLGSLFWIHVDHARYAAADAITADFLERYPGNRLARQMQGVSLYRAGRPAEALAVYQDLKAEYAALPPAPGTLPLGYYRSVGNLARIRAARGERRETDALRAEWARAEKAGLLPWLPSVLRRDLARL